MKKITELVVAIVFALLMAALSVPALWAGNAEFKGFDQKATEIIEKNLVFQAKAGHRTLEIDNIFGAVTVKGYDGDAVKLTAVKTIRAKSKEKLAAAKKEVTLDISENDGYLMVYVDGPFRCKSKDGKKCHGCWNVKKRGYIVQYDFTVHLPTRTGLTARTVTNGDVFASHIDGKLKLRNVNGKITVNNVSGDFDVKTVNGGVVMTGVDGSGAAHTVNGKVVVDFVKNPASECSFKTINGKLDINFLPGLSADFRVKTFTGKVFSDFPPQYLPRKAVKGKRSQGKYVYKGDRFQEIRIGKGGPSISMETLNGKIFIARK